MDLRLVVAPEAAADVSQAFAWYEAQRIGLGSEFLLCVEACLEAICRMPAMQERVHENYRRALVRRFPFAVFYEYDGDNLTVYGVFHTARDPAKWRQRLP